MISSKQVLDFPPRGQARGNVTSLSPRKHQRSEASVFVGGKLDCESVFNRYERTVRAILVRILGVVPDLDDLSQEVFIEALRSVHRLRDEAKIGAFISGIAVNIARSKIRKEQRSRRLRRQLEQEPLDISYEDVDPSVREALATTLRIVRSFPVEERIAFSLRYFEAMDVLDVAESCQVSRSTIKRRLKKAEQRFQTMATEFPVLQSWLSEGRS